MKNFLYGILFCLMLFCAGPAHAQSATLTSGTTTAGTVPSGGTDTQYFTITTAGQSVRASIPNGFSAYANVYNPSGTLLLSGSSGFALNNLTATGTYKVVIGSQVVGGHGPYTVYYVASREGTSGGAVTSGATISDTLAANGLTSYTFSGTTGQGMQIRFAAAGLSYNANVFVYNPDGTYLNYNQDLFNDTSLPQTGTYTVVVEGTSTSVNGSFSLAYVIGGGATSGGAIASGGNGSGTLPAGLMVSYTFSGTAGNAAAISFGDPAWLVWMYVYTPDGHYWSYSSSNNFNATSLPQTGTYTVVAWAQSYSNTGGYHMYFVQGGGNTSEGRLKSGYSDYNNSFASNQLHSYKYYGVSGKAAHFRIGTAISGGTEILFYTPDGHYEGATTGGILNYTLTGALPQTGNYTLVTYPYNYGTTGTYSAYYVTGNDTVSEGVLVSGKARPGNMPLSGILSYRFMGTASATLTGTSACSFDTYGCDVLLYNPDGTYWTYFNGSYTHALPAVTGEYTAVMVPYDNNTQGASSLTLTVTQPPPGSSGPGGGCPCAGGFASPGGAAAGAFPGGAAGSPGAGSAPGAPGGAPASASGNGNISTTGNTMLSSNLNVNGPQLLTGNPINFDVGYKTQSETDYQAGGLNFTRVYRSDSTWTNNTIGTLWRHNYARTLTVVAGTSASIVDGTGITTSYTWSGGAWVPTNSATVATLQTVGSTYVYTLPNGMVEKYNSSKLLTRIEYLAGGALNLTYPGYLTLPITRGRSSTPKHMYEEMFRQKGNGPWL